MNLRMRKAKKKLVIAFPHFSPGNLKDWSLALTKILHLRRNYRKDIQRFKFTVSTVGCMLDFEDFLVYIKLAKILSKTFPFLKKKEEQKKGRLFPSRA